MKIEELEKINLKPKTLEEATEALAQVAKIVIDLKKENDLLKEQLNNNSRNSSLPPSREFVSQLHVFLLFSLFLKF